MTGPRRPLRGRRLAAAGLLAIASVLPAGARAADAPAPSASAAPRTYGILVGCTEYPELRAAAASEAAYRARVRLQGCVNDVAVVAKALTEHLGAAPADVTSFAGWPEEPAARPTEANVRAALVAAAARTYRAGDRVVIHYSGHGVQVKDDDGDETDGLDEVWLLADARKQPGGGFLGILRDDELGEHLRAIRARGAFVWCVMDCCHSATGTRGADDAPTRTRGLDPGAVGVTIEPATTRGLGTPGGRPSRERATEGMDGIVAFYAAQSFQEVPEVRVPERPDGTSYGLLTTALVRALRNAGPAETFEGVFERIVAGYRELGRSHVVQPLAEGDVGRRVADGMPLPSAGLFLRRTADGLALSAGALSGIEEGTELDATAPGAPEDAKPVGRVVVKTIHPDTALVEVVGGPGAPWTKAGDGIWAARIAKSVVGDSSLRLAVVDAAEQPLDDAKLPAGVRSVLDDPRLVPRFPRVSDPARAKWLLILDEKLAPVALAPARRGRAAVRFAVRTTTLEETLWTVFRGENLLRLCAKSPDAGRLPGNLDLLVRLVGPGGERRRIRAGERVTPGSHVEIELVKGPVKGSDDLETMDVFAFWVDPHYAVDRLHPAEKGLTGRIGRDDVKGAGRRIFLSAEGGDPTTDKSQGEERIVVLVAPPRRDEDPLDLHFLAQPGLSLERGAPEAVGEPGLFDDLRDAVPDGTRGGVRKVTRQGPRVATRVFTFRTEWGPIHAPVGAPGDPAARVQGALPPPADPVLALFEPGPDVRLARDREGGPLCFLVGKDAAPSGPVVVLVDLDDRDGGPPRTAAGLPALVRERTFDPELAIRLDGGRVTVGYDTNDDGTIDELRIDADDDRRAETRRRLVDGRWTTEEGVDFALLDSGVLRWAERDGELGARIVARLRSIAAE